MNEFEADQNPKLGAIITVDHVRDAIVGILLRDAEEAQPPVTAVEKARYHRIHLLGDACAAHIVRERIVDV